MYRATSTNFGMQYTAILASSFRMTERSDRLQQAFRTAKLSQADAAERFGWNRNTLKSNLNGTVDFSYKKAQVYAGRLKVRAEWLYSGEGPMIAPPRVFTRPAQEIPVISWVSAGNPAELGQIEEMGDLERMTISGLPHGRFVATDVRGDSMDRVSPEGSRIIFNTEDVDPVSGGYYVCSLRGETTYKRFYDQPIKRLEPFSTNPANRAIYLLDDDEWIVVGRVVRSLIDLD